MLDSTAKLQRFLKVTQLVVSFASTCAVLDASRIDSPPGRLPGYHAGTPLQRDADGDRRLGDLARAERQRREAEQQSHRRGMTLDVASNASAVPERPMPIFAPSLAAPRRNDPAPTA